MNQQLQETLDFVSQYITQAPDAGIVLGTGLGRLAQQIEAEHTISYSDIPHFPVSTVETHEGKLIYGTLGTKKVLAMQGRFHFYEGYTMQQITYPIRLMHLLGIRTLYLSGASGAMNLSYEKGDLVLIGDHINLQTANPLTGPNMSEFGPRFPDMSDPYDDEMIHTAWQIAKEEGYRIHKGVYVAVTGPNLETRAEYRFLRKIGGDLVGMSTVPEVIVAKHQGMKVFATSIITDLGDPDNLEPVSVEEIIRVANEAEPKLTQLFYRMINEYSF
uniref:Purine nucleoside phosphorylase n=1 Tax=Roseihalotalea indica TaxID=2867963 RepID=A0AA49GQY7_9BACT|nr:purine-nucleoside phosphorylase [Tunicatimonas sp. TK19036]